MLPEDRQRGFHTHSYDLGQGKAGESGDGFRLVSDVPQANTQVVFVCFHVRDNVTRSLRVRLFFHCNLVYHVALLGRQMKNMSIRFRPATRKELKELKKLTALSEADVVRQALVLGLPLVKARFAGEVGK